MIDKIIEIIKDTSSLIYIAIPALILGVLFFPFNLLFLILIKIQVMNLSRKLQKVIDDSSVNAFCLEINNFNLELVPRRKYPRYTSYQVQSLNKQEFLAYVGINKFKKSTMNEQYKLDSKLIELNLKSNEIESMIVKIVNLLKKEVVSIPLQIWLLKYEDKQFKIKFNFIESFTDIPMDLTMRMHNLLEDLFNKLSRNLWKK